MGSKKLRKKSRQKTRTLRLNRHQWPTLSRRKPPQRSQSQRRTKTTTSTSTTCKKHYFGGTPPPSCHESVCCNNRSTVHRCVLAYLFQLDFENRSCDVCRDWFDLEMLFWHQSKRYHILTKTRLSFFRFPKLNF